MYLFAKKLCELKVSHYMCVFLICREILRLGEVNENSNLVPVKQIKGLVSEVVVKSLIDEKKFKKVKHDAVEKFISESRVDVEKIQEALDMSGVSRKGYASIFNIVSSTLKDKRIKRVLLPTPAAVWRQRGLLNQEIDDFIGQYFHIQNIYEGAKGRTIYDSLNNIFVELQQLQRRMVEFYNITLEECKGVLKFVIKLDECEIVKEKKIERVTITLMNRALDPSTTKTSSKYFSV